MYYNNATVHYNNNNDNNMLTIALCSSDIRIEFTYIIQYSSDYDRIECGFRKLYQIRGQNMSLPKLSSTIFIYRHLIGHWKMCTVSGLYYVFEENTFKKWNIGTMRCLFSLVLQITIIYIIFNRYILLLLTHGSSFLVTIKFLLTSRKRNTRT